MQKAYNRTQPNMPDFQNAKIYQIWTPGRPDLLPYIGSTTQTLAKRIGGHRRSYKCKQNGKGNDRASFIHIAEEGHRIELIREFPCETRQELLREEGREMRSRECCNQVVPGRTRAEWYEENKERLTAHRRKRYEENKEQVNAHRRKWCEENKESLRAKSKRHYEKHGERVRARVSAYRKANKEQISAKDRKKITCPCGSSISRGSRSKHQRSAKHIRKLAELHRAAHLEAIRVMAGRRLERIKTAEARAKAVRARAAQYQKHRAKCRTAQKAYHAKNREAIKARKRAAYKLGPGKRVKCDCGQTVTQARLASHKETRAHCDLMWPIIIARIEEENASSSCSDVSDGTFHWMNRHDDSE